MINNVLIDGNLTKDVFIKDLKEGKVAEVSIAVNEGFGENKKVSYFDISFFGKQAQFLAGEFGEDKSKKPVGKGDRILVQGRLKQDIWEKDGKKDSKVYIVGNSVEILHKKTDKVEPTTEENNQPY